MTAKISITIEDRLVSFLDSQGDNRSKFINELIAKAEQEKLQTDLKVAYIEQNNDPKFWAEFKLWDSTVGDGIENEA